MKTIKLNSIDQDLLAPIGVAQSNPFLYVLISRKITNGKAKTIYI